MVLRQSVCGREPTLMLAAHPVVHQRQIRQTLEPLVTRAAQTPGADRYRKIFPAVAHLWCCSTCCSVELTRFGGHLNIGVCPPDEGGPHGTIAATLSARVPP